MPLEPPLPIVHLITSGRTTSKTSTDSAEFSQLLELVRAAIQARVSLLQLREKNLSIRVLYELTTRSVALTRGTSTRLLVNDRFDVALSAGADGVQLTSQSLAADLVRKFCGSKFLIGVSSHSLEEARLARDDGADFALFGPVFPTASKRAFGPAQGIDKLRHVISELQAFPVLPIGGVAHDNLDACFEAGAQGIAAIGLLNSIETLHDIVRQIRDRYRSHVLRGT